MSDTENSTLTCATHLEWTNAQGVITRKVIYRKAVSRLARDGTKQLMIEVRGDKSSNSLNFRIVNYTVFNRFMTEGKASITFKSDGCTIFYSNAPAFQLINFLKLIYIKVTGKDDKPEKKNPVKSKLLGNKNIIDEISPATITEMNNAKKKALNTRATITTPSPSTLRKRKKLSGDSKVSPKIPKAKKLFNNPTLGEMTSEQNAVLESVLNGRNVFFTGSAGTGKSFLLKKIIAALPPDVTMATASTGVAACHIGGITLHQFAGIGLGTASVERCKQMMSKSIAGTIWRKTKHLVIDEISMVDGEYFDKIEAVARAVRNNDKPFGGIQLILCGDFLQLPPVAKKGERVTFCFESQAWTKCIDLNYELKIVHRQTDPVFVKILNKLRKGNVTEEITEILKKTAQQKIEGEGILATRLCSHVNEANEINQSQLGKLPGKPRVYMSQDTDSSFTKMLDQQLPVPSRLVLKEGAQVMLLKNINVSSGLVNGARGVVIRFDSDNIPVVHFRAAGDYKAKEEKWSIKTSSGTVVFRKQIPLKLAWAFSIHKSQGLTLDCVEMSLARVFDAGQAYVALSRAQSLKSLKVLDFNAQQVWANQNVLEFYKRFERQMEVMEFIPLGKKLKFGPQY